MKDNLYLDTSALVKLYIAEPGSEELQARCHLAEDLILCPLQETELRNAILAAGGRGLLNQATMRKTLKNLESDLSAGCYKPHNPDWPLVWQHSNELAAAYTPKFLCRTLDILHVAIAKTTDCTCLITGDERQLALCEAINLKAERVPGMPPGTPVS